MSVDAAALRELDELLDVDAEAWRPSAGDKLLGTLVAVDERISSYDGKTPYKVLLVREGGGDRVVAFHCFHTVAAERVAELEQAGKLRNGSLIGIRYLGKKEGRNQTYESYKIQVAASGEVLVDDDPPAEQPPDADPAEPDSAQTDEIPF